MKSFKELFIEEAQKAPAEWRVALGMIKRYFGPDQNPSEDELKDIAQEFAKKGKIEDFTAFHKWVESQITFTKEQGKRIK